MNKMLLPYDIVGGSFWLISVGMIGATLFFFFERSKVSSRFHTPMTMIAVVCLMSSIHYFFVKNLWVVSGTAPTLLRYIDWFLNFPMLVLIFYAMLMTVVKVKQGMFWRLLVGTLVFVVAGFLGAAGYMSKTLGFIVWLAGWLYVLGELYVGEAGRANAKCGNENIQMVFFSNRLIISSISDEVLGQKVVLVFEKNIPENYRESFADLNQYEIPKDIFSIDSFPMSNGKISRLIIQKNIQNLPS